MLHSIDARPPDRGAGGRPLLTACLPQSPVKLPKLVTLSARQESTATCMHTNELSLLVRTRHGGSGWPCMKRLQHQCMSRSLATQITCEARECIHSLERFAVEMTMITRAAIVRVNVGQQ